LEHLKKIHEIQCKYDVAVAVFNLFRCNEWTPKIEKKAIFYKHQILFINIMDLKLVLVYY